MQIMVAWKITKSEFLTCSLEKQVCGDIRMTTILRMSLKLTYVLHVHKLSKPDSACTVIRT